MRPLRRHLTYANVMSSIAVFAVLATGGAYAANTVFSEDIVDGEVKSRDVLNETLTSGDVLNNSLRAADIAEDEINTSEIAPGAVTSAEVDDATLGELKALGFATGFLTPCDPGSVNFIFCGSVDFELPADSAVLVSATGMWSGREAGEDSGLCKISLPGDGESPDHFWGQAANQHDTAATAAALAITHVFPDVVAGEHHVNLECAQGNGDFRTEQVYVSVVRLAR